MRTPLKPAVKMLAAAMFTAPLLIGAGTAAQASTTTVSSLMAYGDCAANYFCSWRDAGGSSMLTAHPNLPGNQGVYYMTEPDKLTSFYNRGTRDVLLMDWNAGRGCYERIYTVGPGGWGNLPAALNDRTDVLKFGYESSLPGACPI